MDVVFEELGTHQGTRLGIITLNSERTLNALTLSMVESMLKQVEHWAQDPNIVCLLIRGTGRAFCAGGDVRKLAAACLEHPGSVAPYNARFFATEYRLDHRLRYYPKPVISWGQGYVLGGGMGLFQTASIRILTPEARLGMPEVRIGLYPDVGASWFFTRLPDKVGLFLSLTASQLNAQDALDLELAEYCLDHEQQSELIQGLVRINWSQQAPLQLHSLLHSLKQARRQPLPDPWITPHRSDIRHWMDQPELAHVWQGFQKLTQSPDTVLAQAAQYMVEGCPLTLHLVWEQFKRARYLSLTEAVQMEYAMSLNCCCHPEFAEGVRARLIDKDNQPNWHWPTLDSVPEAVIRAHFKPLWKGDHPLENLTEHLPK